MSLDKKLNILYFPGDDYPAFRSEITELFCKEIPDNGHNVHLVMFKRKNSIHKMPSLSNLTYHLIEINKWKYKTFIFNRFIKFIYIINLKSCAEKIIKNEKIDLIIARDNPELGMLADILSKIYSIPFVFQMTSLFPEMRKILIKYKPSFRAVVRYIKGILEEKIFHKLIRDCDLFLPISKAMQSHFKKKYPGKKMIPVPLHAPRDFIDYKKVEKYNKDNRIIYVGQISLLREFDFFIEMLKKVKRIHEDVELILLGPIMYSGLEQELRKKAKDFGVIENLKFLGEVSKSEVPDFVVGAVLGLSPIPPTKAYRMSSPTKVVEYLALGVPTVANREIEDQRSVIEESAGGFAVPYDTDEFAEKITYLLDNPEVAEKMGKAGRKWIKRNRTYGLMAEKLENELIKLL